MWAPLTTWPCTASVSGNEPGSIICGQKEQNLSHSVHLGVILPVPQVLTTLQYEKCILESEPEEKNPIMLNAQGTNSNINSESLLT